MSELAERQAVVHLATRRIAAAEWFKLTHTRSTWVLLGLMTFCAAGLPVLLALLQSPDNYVDFDNILTPGEQILNTASGVALNISTIFAVLLGALVVTSEFSTGAIRSTWAAAPRRLSVLIGKWLCVSAISALTILVVLAIALGAWLWAIRGLHYQLPFGGLLQVLLGAVFYQIGLTTFALLAGAIIRSTAGTIAAVFGLIWLVPILISQIPVVWINDCLPWLPAQALVRVATIDHSGDYAGGAWGGLLATIIYVVLLGWPAFWLTRRRDA
ncbi:MAG: ABC transporter permease [Bifidobacteriaceae bacterium]|jgi:ABC-2 type transport system permease protein|nr:ABC transporter permease [Bifidobacteriaceae bacterium]